MNIQPDRPTTAEHGGYGHQHQPVQTTFAWLQAGDVIELDGTRVRVAAAVPYSPSSVQVDFFTAFGGGGRQWFDSSATVTVVAGPTYDQRHAEFAAANKPATREPRRLRAWIAVVASVTALFVGVAAGSSGQPTAQPKLPTNGAEPKVVTETKTVEVVPQSCVEALDTGDRMVEAFNKTLSISEDTLLAIATFDTAGIDAATARMDRVGTEYAGVIPSYQAAADSCRKAARR